MSQKVYGMSQMVYFVVYLVVLPSDVAIRELPII